MQIGILSDSHFEDFPDVSKQKIYNNTLAKIKHIFKDVDHIIHAGDVCTKDFIADLESIAPTTVVMGNIDVYSGVRGWPRTIILEFEGVYVGVVYRPEDIALFDPKEIRVFICGHSHIASINENSDGILIINPGSISKPKAHPKKFLFQQKTNPRPTVGFLDIDNGVISSLIKRI